MRLVIGITGASGSIYGIRLLEVLRNHADIQTHLVISAAGKRTIVEETDYSIADVEALARHRYDVKDIGASIASGSFRTAGMVIAPCSIRTAAAIAACHSDTLVSRAADVTLKEGRPLILVVRSTLGTINHTLLSVEAIRRRGLPLAGVVINGPETPHNRAAIERYGKVEVIAEIPWLDQLTPATLAAIEPELDLGKLARAAA